MILDLSFPSGEIELVLRRGCWMSCHAVERHLHGSGFAQHLCRPGKWFRATCSDVKPTSGDGGKDRAVGGDAPSGREKSVGCKKQISLRRKARTVIRFLSRELRLERAHPLPPLIQCGQLRSAIRSVFPVQVTCLQELSIKTSQKIESGACDWCAKHRFASHERDWKEARFRPADVYPSTVHAFKRALRCLVDEGWNRGEFPYVPTGNGTRTFARKVGGSWNFEEFSGRCRLAPVFSSGKPRLVTLYSSQNSEVLSPLHQALYAMLKRKGWLLVGSPTNELVASLNGGGDYVSIDYQSATDMIKQPIVEAAIDVLIEKSVGLTVEEVECLRVVAAIDCSETIPGFEEFASRKHTRGQPMGSLMSFPLLCLINKTVVDLAIADMLSAGLVSAKEFTGHRCLINGDDLLFREPLPEGGHLFAGILRWGSDFGLIVNKEKTMKDPILAEINSTLFIRAEKQKKTNCAALFMGRDVTDVIGFAADSCRSRWGFKQCVLRASEQLSRQQVKLYGPVPLSFLSVLRGCRELKSPLCSVPISERTKAANLFPVVTKPAGYDLSRREEVATINREVLRLREGEYWRAGLLRPVQKKILTKECGTVRAALRKRRTIDSEEVTLQILSRRWEELAWDELRASDTRAECGYDLSPFSDLPVGFSLVEFLRACKNSGALRGHGKKEGGLVVPWSSDYVCLSGY